MGQTGYLLDERPSVVRIAVKAVGVGTRKAKPGTRFVFVEVRKKGLPGPAPAKVGQVNPKVTQVQRGGVKPSHAVVVVPGVPGRKVIAEAREVFPALS